jgi:hypothetical protein
MIAHDLRTDQLMLDTELLLEAEEAEEAAQDQLISD